MLKLKHYDKLGTVRFITFSCYRRLNLFVNDQSKNIFLKHLKQTCIKYEIKILGYVVMLNHVHLVLHPEDTVSIGRVIGELKSLSAREILLHYRQQNNTLLKQMIKNNKQYVFWQRRCYDHNCRTPKTVIEKINYCHNNPVRAGLVSQPVDWYWSSCRWYQGLDNIL